MESVPNNNVAQTQYDLWHDHANQQISNKATHSSKLT